MTTGVVLFSHGSLLCGSEQALIEHSARLREFGVADIVEPGFLNYNNPTFPVGVARAIEQGADTIVVAPYFLAPGKFVTYDLPKAIAAAQGLYPTVRFIVADPLGFDERLANAVVQSAQNASSRDCWRIDLHTAPAYCRYEAACPLFGGEYCSGGSEPIAITGPEPSMIPPVGSEALLVMVHGSPRGNANEAALRIAELLRAQALFSCVEVGFMECNEPDIPMAIQTCVQSGANTITAVPYFLHTGTHVADDLPTLLETAVIKYPDVLFRLGRFLGFSQALTDILRDRITAVLPSSAPY